MQDVGGRLRMHCTYLVQVEKCESHDLLILHCMYTSYYSKICMYVCTVGTVHTVNNGRRRVRYTVQGIRWIDRCCVPYLRSHSFSVSGRARVYSSDSAMPGVEEWFWSYLYRPPQCSLSVMYNEPNGRVLCTNITC